MCTSRKLDPSVSRLPRTQDICPLFAGIHLLISALQDWRSGSRRQQRPHVGFCH